VNISGDINQLFYLKKISYINLNVCIWNLLLFLSSGCRSPPPLIKFEK
jgi:hypothetical protein